MSLAQNSPPWVLDHINDRFIECVLSVCVCVYVCETERDGEEPMEDKNLSKMHTVLWTCHISLSYLKSPNKIS